MVRDDAPFVEPAQFLVVPDHYLPRMLVSPGETLPRRIDAGCRARLVVEHRLDLDEAVDTAADLANRGGGGPASYTPPAWTGATIKRY